ncbi:MAG TPA: glycosyltransferase [Pseudobdellovibrionaceae bacterium]|nr:glycosyltransferase [Pseudobdellovibrionaceae bacterium]
MELSNFSLISIYRSFWWPTRTRILKMRKMLKNDGFFTVTRKLYFLFRNEPLKRYPKGWLERYEKDLFQNCPQLKNQIKVSILVPVYNIDDHYLRKMLDSVLAQTYTNWELCLSDDNSSLPHVRKTLVEYQQKDSRIKVFFRTENGHISVATNSALSIATGEYCAFLDHDDEIHPTALSYVVDAIEKNPEAIFLYSDEDILDDVGFRQAPNFKPDWDTELILGANYICHFSVMKTDHVKSVGGCRKGYEGSQDYDLVLRVTSSLNKNQIVHVPKILYHWRMVQNSVSMDPESKPYAHTAARRAIQDYLESNNIPAHAGRGYGYWHRVIYNLPNPTPKVSLLIPIEFNREISFSKKIVHDILFETNYYNLEILILPFKGISTSELPKFEKTSPIRILEKHQVTNLAEALQQGVLEAQGHILGVIPSSCEVQDSEWLTEAVRLVTQPKIGLVGGLLKTTKNTFFNTAVDNIKNPILTDAKRDYFKKLNLHDLYRYRCVHEVSLNSRLFFFALKKELINLDTKTNPFHSDEILCKALVQKNLRLVWSPFVSLKYQGPE